MCIRDRFYIDDAYRNEARRTVRAAVEGYPAGMHRSVAEQGPCSGSGSAGGSGKEWKAKEPLNK